MKEINIPIAKDAQHIKRIGNMVKKSINDSIEARELARKVRSEVFNLGYNVN